MALIVPSLPGTPYRTPQVRVTRSRSLSPEYFAGLGIHFIRLTAKYLGERAVASDRPSPHPTLETDWDPNYREEQRGTTSVLADLRRSVLSGD